MRIYGHPPHPAMVHLPFGLLAAVPLLDAAVRIGLAPAWDGAARAALDLGLLASIPAVLTGLLDLAALGAGHRGIGTAFIHLTAIGCALCAFGAARLTWDGGPLAAGLCWAGLAALALGGASGGHLVYVDGACAPPEQRP
jgi:uncharacterized membrane protein